MTLDEWLARLQAPKHNRIDLGLSRITLIAKRLGLGRFTCPVITVGGTNGKGSTVACIEAMACHSGLEIASYTSPHLLSVNERIRFNRQNVADSELCQGFAMIADILDVNDNDLSYFEWFTLCALLLFSRRKLDLIVLEVGLGGRLDATNMIDADCAIVTSIGLDHQEYLGDTLEAIAYEKAGIFRKGCLAIAGSSSMPSTLSDHALAIGARLRVYQQDFNAECSGTTHWQLVTKDNVIGYLPLPTIKLSNAACAIYAVSQLPLAISNLAIRQALNDIVLVGRCQWIERPIVHLLDVAHNEAAFKALADTLSARAISGCIRFVFSMLKSKNSSACVNALQAMGGSWYCATLAHGDGASEKQLKAALLPVYRRLHWFDDLTSAYSQALADSQAGDCIVICGSFHTLAEIYPKITKE